MINEEVNDDVNTTPSVLFSVGMKVLVKPNSTRCTSEWEEGTMTHVRNGLVVEVDGIPRHIADVRRLGDAATNVVSSIQPSNDSQEPRAERQKKVPNWLNDYHW